MENYLMKKQTARITADRAEQLGKSKVRAGKSKASAAVRKKQNAGVKDGTIRLGKSGKSYNVYDAKSGTWKRGVVRAATPKPSGAEGPKQSIPRKKTGSPARIIGRDVTPPSYKPSKQYGTGVYRSR